MADNTKLLAMDAVVVGVDPMSKEEAIRFVGDRLVERGHVDPSYVDSMVEREKTVTTFLGNGVAMPHGTAESKDAVKSTGIIVAQCPQGIDWGVGTAHLVIGLGAQGDDHVHILSHIAEVLQDEEAAEALWTADQETLHEALNMPVPDDEGDGHGDDGGEAGALSEEITICPGAGLHARPASLIVDLAKNFDGDIKITKNGKSARADSIMAVLSLGAVATETVAVEIEGDSGDSAEAMAEIRRILTTPEAEL